MARTRKLTDTEVRELIDGTRVYRHDVTPRQPVTPRARRDIYQSGFAQDDAAFDRKMDQLARVYEHPSPAYKAYLDRWYGTPATWQTGGGECAYCLRPTDGENLCSACAYSVVDRPEPGDIRW